MEGAKIRTCSVNSAGTSGKGESESGPTYSGLFHSEVLRHPVRLFRAIQHMAVRGFINLPRSDLGALRPPHSVAGADQQSAAAADLNEVAKTRAISAAKAVAFLFVGKRRPVGFSAIGTLVIRRVTIRHWIASLRSQ